MNSNYRTLLRELDDLIGKKVTEGYLDAVFEKYDWQCMGLTFGQWMGLTFDGRLIYIESPMGKEIDLVIEVDEWGIITIKKIEKRFWD